MELYSSEQYGLLEEYLLGLRDTEPSLGAIDNSSSSSSSANFPATAGEFCTISTDQDSSSWLSFYYSNFMNSGDDNTFDLEYNSPPAVDQSLQYHELYSPFGDPSLEFHPSQQGEIFYDTNSHVFGNIIIDNVHLLQNSLEVPTTFNMGTDHQVSRPQRRNNKVKKPNGQPSKNLQAERRRRNRLNDRLSMLRSIVPKISKMDRTSILGDTIDYVKELLDRINKLQAQNYHHHQTTGSNQLTIFKDEAAPNEIFIRNSPKFEVERRNGAETRIDISCAGKPGLLLSTLTTMEAQLGLQIRHCVISCFNDFSMQASCHHQEMEQKAGLISSEADIKQALFRNAGYGGICL